MESWGGRRHSPDDTAQRTGTGAGTQLRVAGSPSSHPHAVSCLPRAAVVRESRPWVAYTLLSSPLQAGLGKEGPVCVGTRTLISRQLE